MADDAESAKRSHQRSGASTALTVAMIGVVGSVGGLVYKDYRDDARQAAFEAETALVSMDEAIVAWDLGIPSAMEEHVAEHWPVWTTFAEEPNVTPEQRRTWDEQWALRAQELEGDLFAADTAFGEVRRAYNDAVRHTQGDEREAVVDYFRAARNRLYGLIRVSNQFPASSVSKVSKEDRDMLTSFAKESLIIGRYTGIDTGEAFDECPRTFRSNDTESMTVQQTSDCLVSGHYWFAEQVLNTLNGE